MRLGVLTSGGDSPGMNACVRTVVLAAVSRGHTCVGIRLGYTGLLRADTQVLDPAAVDGISRLGGTVLGSARSAEFPTAEGQRLARQRLVELGLDALVVVGGSGSLAGAHALSQGVTTRIVGIPASIDNDIGHSGMAIGVDTAVNTIVEACDRISDTARAHQRVFVVEVMGRHCGFLAMRAGLAAEADAILYAESGTSEDATVASLRAVVRRCFQRGRVGQRCLIVKAEGVRIPTRRLVDRLAEHLQEDAPDADVRETVLGHVVRGGSPSALDRLIAQRLGYAGALAAEAGAHDVMLGWETPDRDVGKATADHSVRMVGLPEVLEETRRLLDGTSPVMQRRVKMLKHVEGLLAL
jgi:6-phosphofructokinase 1